MHRLKKALGIVLLLGNLVACAEDNYTDRTRTKVQEKQCQQAHSSTALWAGVAGFVGAVAGVAVGSWLTQNQEEIASRSTILVAQPVEKQELPLLSYKGRQIKEKLNQLSKYGNDFELRNNFQTLVINLYKLGFRLDDIDSNFFNLLAQDHKVLNDAGYSIWWNSFTSLENQKNVYLTNCKALISYFYRNQNFIQSCQIVNSYDRLPEYFSDLPSWIRLQYRGNQQYPLLFYADKVQADIYKLARLRNIFRSFHQPFLDRLERTERKLENLLQTLYNCCDYSDEVSRKRQVELLEQYNRLEEKKLEIARKQADALEQANRLAVERNRIEQMRNQFYRDGM